MAKLIQHTYSQAQLFVVKSFSLGFFKVKMEHYPVRVDPWSVFQPLSCCCCWNLDQKKSKHDLWGTCSNHHKFLSHLNSAYRELQTISSAGLVGKARQNFSLEFHKCSFFSIFFLNFLHTAATISNVIHCPRKNPIFSQSLSLELIFKMKSFGSKTLFLRR